MTSLSESTANPIIIAKNVSKTVRTADADASLDILSSVDLIIQSAETLAIVGESGSGKTTLLSLLAGLDTPTSGSIILDGCDITQLDEDGRADVRSRLIGFVFQSFQLLPALSALENVMLPLELKNQPQAAAIAESLLERVGLSHRLQHTPRLLSGGEQQRVALARAFAGRPAILFADEPTGNLDSKTGAHIIDLMFEMNQEQQTTLILVTHDRRLADRCRRSICLADGKML